MRRFVRGYSGFGSSALVIAASSLVTNPLNFVAVVVILETLMSLQAARGAGPACGLAAGRALDGWGRWWGCRWGCGLLTGIARMRRGR